ncbi:MAG: hypothetical protein LBI87_12430 [Candidatus Accumulibacter sp.]|jgi:hypothetical protein|nr:hypothetical protein [Accumulibacter sp.]
MDSPDSPASRLFGLAASLLLGAAVCVWPGRALAADEASPGIRESAFSLRGFGSLGVARSTNGDAPRIQRNSRQPDGVGNRWSARHDSVLGLQARYRFSDRVSATVQAVSYYNDEGNFKPDATAAYLKFDLDPGFFARVGRVPLDLLMLAETRMVGYSYITIRSASEWYHVPINYVDGINARWRVPVGEGVINIDGTAGFTRENLPDYKSSGSKMAKGSISYEVDAWQFRYFYARTRLAHDIDEAADLRRGLVMTQYPSAIRAADKLALKNTASVHQSLGVGYDDGAWQMQVAINTVRYENYISMDGKGMLYAMLARRVGNVTPYIGYSRAKIDPKSLTTGLPAATGIPDLDDYYRWLDARVAEAMVISSMRNDAKTFTLGTRWDFRPNMALKAQIDHMRGLRARGSSAPWLMNAAGPDWNGKTTMLNVSLDFVF